ncbi:enhancer of split M2 protein [Calliphora vicina]|uniref:enhancer of split M2 protein n=1 Tax=Calliphora vicina TaxID=7373 RepID=UPI00325B9BF8
MFTDTKNLANLTVNTTNAAAKQINTHSPDDEKFKLKKMWKPILRLMSRKSALAKNGKRDNNSSTIPNNVNLNNASQYTSTNKDTLATMEDSSTSSSVLTQKLPLAEFWQTQLQQEQHQHQTSQQQQTSTQPLEFISKASIDKTPLDTCTNCVYGRNCQHTQFHQTPTMDENVNPNLIHTPLTHHQQNFNYFDAEDGCFVWSDNSADIDENALREWLWQNSWQFAENATMC